MTEDFEGNPLDQWPNWPLQDDEPSDNMTDAEADADTLASAGMGTDEDYNHYCYEGDSF